MEENSDALGEGGPGGTLANRNASNALLRRLLAELLIRFRPASTSSTSPQKGAVLIFPSLDNFPSVNAGELNGHPFVLHEDPLVLRVDIPQGIDPLQFIESVIDALIAVASNVPAPAEEIVFHYVDTRLALTLAAMNADRLQSIAMPYSVLKHATDSFPAFRLEDKKEHSWTMGYFSQVLTAYDTLRGPQTN